MPLLLQHILVLLLVAFCGGVIVYHLVQTFRRKPSRLGACCVKGCPPEASPAARTAFVPADALSQRAAATRGLKRSSQSLPRQ